MAKNKTQKTELLDSYLNKINSSKSIVFVKQKGLKVNALNDFRKTTFEMNSQVSTVKNTIFNLAMSRAGLDTKLEGGSYLALFISDDVVNVSKTLKKFLVDFKDNKNTELDIAFSVYEGSVLTKEQTEELADMPDKVTSVSMILGVLDQAMSSVVNVLEDPVRSYVAIINQAFTN